MDDIGSLAPVEQGKEDVKVEEGGTGDMDLHSKNISQYNAQFLSTVSRCSTYSAPFASPWKSLLGPPKGVFVPKGVDEHGDATGDIAQKDHARKTPEDVFGCRAKARPNLARAVITSTPPLGGWQWFTAWSLNLGLHYVLFLLGVYDAVPRGTNHKGHQEDESIEVLGIAQDNVGEREVVTAVGGPGRRRVVGNRHGGLGDVERATPGRERKTMEATTKTRKRRYEGKSPGSHHCPARGNWQSERGWEGAEDETRRDGDRDVICGRISLSSPSSLAWLWL